MITALDPGTYVNIVDGEHEREYGTIVRTIPRQVDVRVTGIRELVRMDLCSVSVAETGDQQLQPSVSTVNPPISSNDNDWSRLSATSTAVSPPPARVISPSPSESDSDDDSTHARAEPYDPIIHPTGSPIRVVRGSYKGRQGKIGHPTNKMVYVQLETPLETKRISQKNVVIMTTSNVQQPRNTGRLRIPDRGVPEEVSSDATTVNASSSLPRNATIANRHPRFVTPDSSPSRSSNLNELHFVPYDPTLHPAGTPARIVKGSYKGRQGAIDRPTSKMVYIQLEAPVEMKRISQESVVIATTVPQPCNESQPAASHREVEVSSAASTVNASSCSPRCDATVANGRPRIVTPDSSPSRSSIVNESPPQSDEARSNQPSAFQDALEIASIHSYSSVTNSMVTADSELYEEAVSVSTIVENESPSRGVETRSDEPSMFDDALEIVSLHSIFSNDNSMVTAESEIYEDAVSVSSIVSMDTDVFDLEDEAGVTNSEYNFASENTIEVEQDWSNEDGFFDAMSDMESPSEPATAEQSPADKLNQYENRSDRTNEPRTLYSRIKRNQRSCQNVETASTERATTPCYSSQDDFRERSRTPQSSHRNNSSANNSPVPVAALNWRVEGRDSPPLDFAGIEIEKISLLPLGLPSSKHRTFTHQFFGSRTLAVDLPIPRSTTKARDIDVPPELEWHGRHYSLLCTKGHQESTQNIRNGGPRARVTLHYVAVSGPGLQSFDLQEELNKIGDFAALAPHKAAARLELLQSPAMSSNIKERELLILDDLSSDDFEEIDEECGIGCGYVPRGYIRRLLGNHAVGKRTTSLQVRIFAPRLGVIKGVLEEKAGITKIQIRPSMIKVPPSRTVGEDWACLLVTNRFPSSTNVNVAKILRGEPTPASFTDDVRRQRLKPMVPRIWEGLGVPRGISRRYVQASSTPEHLQHAFVGGVADPTGGYIPEGHVFVPGMAHFQRDVLFVTRCPCIEPEDGHLLPVVTSKPAGMPQEEWNRLNEQHFGTIIFGNSHNGRLPLPETIADGDLDGDLYFICWNDEIITNVHPVHTVLKKATVEIKETARRTGNEGTWLRDAQGKMVDITAFAELSHLIGKLYSRAMEIADKKSPRRIHDQDCRALGRAYKKALDHAKHGGALYLPMHLWDQVPEHLHCYLMLKEKE